MTTIKHEYDCVVMGGGPAGSTVAALVAEAGHDVLLVDRDKFPRFHVGESLMPETYWTFERLGVLDKMRSSSFVKKVSVQFVSHSGKESQPFFFPAHDPRECSQTWQVERGPFDQMLWENAAEKGATCRDETRVLDVLWADGGADASEGAGAARRATGVRLQLADGSRHKVRAPVVVDATGQQSLVASTLGIRRVNPDLKKAAIWTYYRGAQRAEGEHGGGTIILLAENKRAWFWYIPLADDVTSVGVVGDNDYLLSGRGTTADVFADELRHCGAVAERLADAERVDEFRVTKEFSYSTDQAAGDGWVLVGDAWGFIDPIYSSGVFFALKSGELAADCIVAGLAAGDTSAARLGAWADEFAAGTLWIRKLIRAFYTHDFSFGRFMKAHPRHQGALTDLLIGRIFQEGAGEIFKDMDPWIDAADQAK